MRWRDPSGNAAIIKELSGLEVIQGLIDGVLSTPPLESLLQLRYTEVGPGRVTVTCVPDESAYNGFGIVHGGVLCALLDVVSGSSLHSTLPRGKGYTSIEIKVSYLRAVRPGTGSLTATGTVVRAGSRVGFTEGVVVDDHGNQLASSTSSLLIFDM